jgi:hypothetical protein
MAAENRRRENGRYYLWEMLTPTADLQAMN